ncbi:hypothetical protein COU57_01105 [Candidatus Pacearchaeota archaeon CG10_big_fil_rev_8_21_14_0_10_32_14]|nr:MAG: hypothetical protein COU57_01105 [Candidatus Pacearchaeota archaeon CG10_big_fil_rev_8_21_14_0_10_32_14]
MIIKGKKRELENKAASSIVDLLIKTIRKKGIATLEIPGGGSVGGILRLLAEKQIPWKKLHIFMVDERLVYLNDKDSNYKLVYNTLLKKIIRRKNKLPKENFHPFVLTEKINKDIENYMRGLKEVSDYFDIVLLSADEDRHVASLFPNHETIKSKKKFFTYKNKSTKLPKGRMSASINFYQNLMFPFCFSLASQKGKHLRILKIQKCQLMSVLLKLLSKFGGIIFS